MEEKLKALRNEKLKINEEISEKAGQYDEPDQKVSDAERRAGEIDRQMGNLIDPEILSMVKGFYSEFMAFSKSLLSSGNMTQLSLKIRTINTDKIQTLNLLTEKANSNLQVISNEDLVSEIELSEKRSKLKEEIEKERENALNQMNAFMAHNPGKLLGKILDNTVNAMKKIEGAEDDGAGGMYLNKFSSGFIRGNLQEGMKYTNYLMDQVENKERRAK